MIPMMHGILQQDQAHLSVSPSSLNKSYTAGTLTFNIIASGSWTLEENGRILWLTESPTSGTGNTTVTVTFKANSGAYREGQLIVTQGDLTAYVDVSQDEEPI